MFLFKSSAPGPCSAGANHSALAVSLGHVMTTQDPGGLCTPKTLWVSLNATAVPCGPREATRVPGQPLLAWPWLAKFEIWTGHGWPGHGWPGQGGPGQPDQASQGWPKFEIWVPKFEIWGPLGAKIRDPGAKIRDF